MHLPPPTWATLRELEPFSSADEAMAWAATRTVAERQPQVIGEGAARVILLPGDPGHPSQEDVRFESRFVMVNGRWLPQRLV